MKSITTTIAAASLALGFGAGTAIAAPTAATPMTQTPATGSSAAANAPMAKAAAVIQDARIAGMKATLKLTADQEKYWGPFQSALHDSYTLHDQMMASTRHAFAKDDPIQLLDMLSNDASQGADQIKKVADAAKPLYDSLDATQKQEFGVLLLTLRNNPMMAATRAQHAQRLLMRRWAQAESSSSGSSGSSGD